jgi:hypothetical protein
VVAVSRPGQVRVVFDPNHFLFQQGLIEVEGVDISRLVYAMDWHGEVGYIPELTLKLRPVTGHEFKYEGIALVTAVVELATAAHKALVLAGWTPPEEDT